LDSHLKTRIKSHGSLVVDDRTTEVAEEVATGGNVVVVPSLVKILVTL
jgi:hypothetical protein